MNVLSIAHDLSQFGSSMQSVIRLRNGDTYSHDSDSPVCDCGGEGAGCSPNTSFFLSETESPNSQPVSRDRGRVATQSEPSFHAPWFSSDELISDTQAYYFAIDALSLHNVTSLSDVATRINAMPLHKIDQTIARLGQESRVSAAALREWLSRLLARSYGADLRKEIRLMFAYNVGFCQTLDEVTYYDDAGLCRFKWNMRHDPASNKWVCDEEDMVCDYSQVECEDCGGHCEEGRHFKWTIRYCGCTGGNNDCKEKRRKDVRDRAKKPAADGGDILPWVIVAIAVAIVVAASAASGGAGAGTAGEVIAIAARMSKAA